MAVVESAERDVVPEFGVPLLRQLGCQRVGRVSTHGPKSDGVSGLDGAGGRPMNVGVDMFYFSAFLAVDSLSAFVVRNIQFNLTFLG